MRTRFASTFMSMGCVVWLLVTLTTDTAAQVADPWSFETRGGPVIPAGALSDIADVGIAAGASFAYQFHRNFATRVNLDLDFFDDVRDSERTLISQMNLVHVTAGLEARFDRPAWQDLPLTSAINVGLGLTHMNEDELLLPDKDEEFSETYFSVRLGAEIGYQLTDLFNLYVAGQGFLILIEKADTRPIAARSPEIDPFGVVWSIPITLGLRVMPGRR